MVGETIRQAAQEMTRLRLYNPAQLAPEELKASFVARKEALEEMLLLLKEQPPDRPCQHLLLIGPRGMGKTTLGLRFLHAVQELPDLAERWQPVPYYEENYEIGDLAGFWLAALRHLTRATGDPSWERRANALVQEEQNRDRCAAYALAALVDYCKEIDKRLILFVENLDTVFAQLRDEREVHALRADLLTRPEILVLGSANAVFEAIRSHGQPFYEFFRLVFLESMSQKETERLLATLVQPEDRTDVPRALSSERGRLETIRRLTGGNPRLLAPACRMLLDSPLGSAFDDLEQLIDEQTPYFKARFEELPPQARKIFHCLADGWKPMLAKEVAGATQLNSSHASAQLRQLLDRRYIREVRLPGEKRTRYEVSDRFYNLYCVLRFSSSNRLRLERLVAFLHDLFGTTGMRSIYPRFLEVLRQDGRRGQATADWLEILAGHVAADRDFPDREHWRHQALNLAASLIGPSAPVIANIERAFTVPRRTAPSDQDEWLKLAAEHYNSERYDDAAQAFRNVLNTQPDNLFARAGLGLALNSAERYEEATEAFDRFLENARGEDSRLSTLLTIVVLGSKSVACLQMERHTQGIAALDQLSRHVSSNDPPLIRSIYARVCWLDGHTLAEAGRSLEAIEIWRQGLEFVRPDDLADLRYVAAISLEGMAHAFVALGGEGESACCLGCRYRIRQSGRREGTPGRSRFRVDQYSFDIVSREDRSRFEIGNLRRFHLRMANDVEVCPPRRPGGPEEASSSVIGDSRWPPQPVPEFRTRGNLRKEGNRDRSNQSRGMASANERDPDAGGCWTPDRRRNLRPTGRRLGSGRSDCRSRLSGSARRS